MIYEMLKKQRRGERSDRLANRAGFYHLSGGLERDALGAVVTIERYIVVGGPGLGMSTTTKFVWGFASSRPNSDKKVSTTPDFAVARIF
jgi:hypothetical protein